MSAGSYPAESETASNSGRKEGTMANMREPTYRLSEIVGASTESIQQAVRNGLSRAHQTVRNIEWFEVTQIRGTVNNGDVEAFQVAMKIGFRVEE
jgi:flavin-binding protein dodecin